MFGLFKKQPHIIGVSCVFNCGREKCPLWIKFNRVIVDEKTKEVKQISESKCSHAWNTILMVELLQILKGLTKNSKSSIIKI